MKDTIKSSEKIEFTSIKYPYCFITPNDNWKIIIFCISVCLGICIMSLYVGYCIGIGIRI